MCSSSQATELGHEAYARLVDATRVGDGDRGHSFTLASRAMRHVLVDHARRRGSGKRGGGWKRLPLESVFDLGVGGHDELTIALGEAMERLAAAQPERARVVGQSVNYEISRKNKEVALAVKLGAVPEDVFARMVDDHMINDHVSVASAAAVQ